MTDAAPASYVLTLFCTARPGIMHAVTGLLGEQRGNILQNDLDDVRNDANFSRMANDIRRGVERCEKSCQYFSLCGGGAPSNKYFENHSFDSQKWGMNEASPLASSSPWSAVIRSCRALPSIVRPS